MLFRSTTIEGTGSVGHDLRPMWILRRAFDVAQRLVTLTVMDIQDLVVPAGSQAIVGDESVSPITAGLVGDETIPTGFLIAGGHAGLL